MDVLMSAVNIHKRKRDEEETSANKYAKRSDLEREKQVQLLKEDEEKIRIAKEKEEKKMKELLERYKVLGQKADEKDAVLDKDEVIKRLKLRGVPITLFGEDDAARAERLRELELKEPMEAMPETLEGSAFMKATMQTEEDDEDILTQKKKRTEEADPDFKIDNITPTCPEEEVWFYFRGLVHQMGDRLKNRPEQERKSAQGRMETTKHKQTMEFLRPFFRMCRNKTVSADIINACKTIVVCLKEKNYVEANNAYYKMAIGNDPWPMGVTMVGIHERSAQEKIACSGNAHILNDDVQRKYISALKRLMTFAQTLNPTKPSMSVM